MNARCVKVQPLTAEAFAPFGWLLGPASTPADFGGQGVYEHWYGPRHVAEAGEELTLDYYVAYCRPLLVSSMHRHTRSLEGFVPLNGISIFAVCPASESDDLAAYPDPQQVQAFLVGRDRGVMLQPGVWHVAHFPLEGTAGYLIIKSACSGDQQDTGDLKTEVQLELQRGCQVPRGAWSGRWITRGVSVGSIPATDNRDWREDQPNSRKQE